MAVAAAAPSACAPLSLYELLRHCFIWLAALARCLLPGARPLHNRLMQRERCAAATPAAAGLLGPALTHARRAGARAPAAVRVSGRRLAALPPALPRHVRSLDASCNVIVALPRQLGALRFLRSLDLSGNGLRALPVRRSAMRRNCERGGSARSPLRCHARRPPSATLCCCNSSTCSTMRSPRYRLRSVRA
jgi:hypothetical protein